MSAELTYNSVRIAHNVRENEERKNNERKKQLLCIIVQHLQDEGYFESARAVIKESGLSDNYEVCDNVDLRSIVKEYEAYCFVRFQKYPKLCRKVDAPSETASKVTKHAPRRKQVPRKPIAVDAGDANGESLSLSKDLTVQALPLSQSQHGTSTAAPEDPVDVSPSERLLKPLAGLALDGEWKQFAEIISRDISLSNPNVRWSDIKGLDEPKRLLREAVVYPTKYPELFSGILTPWKGLLLYGPSGTGKTLLAKAVATECGTTFFNVSASTLVSKWRGDSEKLVRVLFELARHHAPSTVFVDEVDALAGRRGGVGEHEASRRLQAELLVQLDGLNEQADGSDRVFMLVTSNLPWDLDSALLRRLEKRILVDLPALEAREEICRHYLPPGDVPAGPAPAPGKRPARPVLRCQLDYRQIAEETEGYSGADLRLVCKEAAMQSVRGAFQRLESGAEDGSRLRLDVVTMDGVRAALSRTKPCGASDAPRFRSWQEQFGAL